MLEVPNIDGIFKVECDASKYAVGAELSQKQEGKWHTVAFLSKSLSPAECNYEIYDREMLSVMTALDEWRHFLMGTQKPFEIFNDHKNLEYFKNHKNSIQDKYDGSQNYLIIILLCNIVQEAQWVKQMRCQGVSTMTSAMEQMKTLYLLSQNGFNPILFTAWKQYSKK